MHKILAALLTAGSMLFGTSAAAQQFTLLSSWDSSYPYNPYLLEPFVEGLSEATDGRITIDVLGPETVPPFEQLEPVGAGVFDFLFTSGAYHFGTTPLFTIAEALVGDSEKAREVGLFDYLDEHYQQFGLKLVMLPITPQGAYHILLRKPVGDSGDLSGEKIRGTLTYQGVVEGLGGSLTVIPASEIYTALEKGVVDGAGWPVIGALDYRWYEVADYLMRPGFGVNYEPFFMNLDAWNALSEEDQNIMMEISKDIEGKWNEDALEIWAKEEELLKEKGMKVTEIGKAQQEQLQTYWAEGLWELGMDEKPDLIQDFRDFATSKGMAE